MWKLSLRIMTSFNDDWTQRTLPTRKSGKRERIDNANIRNNIFVWYLFSLHFVNVGTLEQVKKHFALRFSIRRRLCFVAFVIGTRKRINEEKYQLWTMMRCWWWYFVWNGFISVSIHMAFVWMGETLPLSWSTVINVPNSRSRALKQGFIRLTTCGGVKFNYNLFIYR